jgi:hypothetical protein
MRTHWEYSHLVLTCDPGKDPTEARGYLALPDATAWKELGLVANITALLNELGRDGWELVGAPSDLNAVYSYQAANSTWHDRAYFVERRFWLKRPAST